MLKVLTLISFFAFHEIYAQTISGHLPNLANQEIKLEAFNGFKTYQISIAKIDQEGKFNLNYTANDYGIGFLRTAENKPLFIILCEESIELKGEALSNPESIVITKGLQNQQFFKYATDHPKREKALSAWNYLEKIYLTDSMFSKESIPVKAILNEKRRLKNQDSIYIATLKENSFVKWYLPMRKLMSSASTIAQQYPEEITATIEAYRKVDLTDQRLYKSGLYKDAVEAHFWLIENSGNSIEENYITMKKSIDVLLLNLIKDPKKLNEITDYLFDLLEQHSLFEASEYLALKVLNEVSCTIDSDLAKQLETYRVMKKGNIAPNFDFKGDVIKPSNKLYDTALKLSDIGAKYYVVVFGASWCPKCKEEIPLIASLYSKWKAQDVEVIFVSLDEEKQAFTKFASGLPFISMCDYKKWNSDIVNQYYVFGTPTMFLLDSNRKIVLRPNSVKQMDAWVDWFLLKK